MTPTMQILRRTHDRTPRRAVPPPAGALLTAILLSVAPVVLRSAPAVSSSSASGGSPAEIESRLRGAASAIEQAFIRCDASFLAGVLSRRMKIYVSTVSFGIDPAYYGPGQMQVLMQRVCEGRTTLRFTPLAAPRQPQQDADTTFLAQWISRASDGVEDDVRLAFVLEPEETAWQIREIRQLK